MTDTLDTPTQRIPHARLRAFQRVRGYCPAFVVRYAKFILARDHPEAVFVGSMSDFRSLHRITMPNGETAYVIWHAMSGMIVTFLTAGQDVWLNSPRGRFLLLPDGLQRAERPGGNGG